MGTTLLPKTKQTNKKKLTKTHFPSLKAHKYQHWKVVMDKKDHTGRMSRERTADLGERS